MTHLVIWSSLRSGSHMLRSMLAADLRVLDAGEYVDLDGNGFRSFMSDCAGQNPGKIIVSNPKWGAATGAFRPIVSALQDAGAKVILMHRRDLLAQQASWALAASTGAFRGVPAAHGTLVALDPHRTGAAMFRHGLHLEQIRLALRDTPHVELAYEDISVPSVQAALAFLDIDLTVTEPTTLKSAPPRLADFVTNLSELP